MTLDSANLSRCDLIKADVEGMEWDVMEGARKTIARFRPTLYVENDRLEKSTRLMRNAYPNVVSFNMLCIPTEKNVVIDLRPVDGPYASP